MINKWKNATIILGIFYFVLLSIQLVLSSQTYNFKEDNFSIKRVDLERILDHYQVGEKVKLCNFDGGCIEITKLE